MGLPSASAVRRFALMVAFGLAGAGGAVQSAHAHGGQIAVSTLFGAGAGAGAVVGQAFGGQQGAVVGSVVGAVAGSAIAANQGRVYSTYGYPVAPAVVTYPAHVTHYPVAAPGYYPPAGYPAAGYYPVAPAYNGDPVVYGAVPRPVYVAPPPAVYYAPPRPYYGGHVQYRYGGSGHHGHHRGHYGWR